ncbi:hypothetical protein A2763_01840 [Candidatus Kaiserbacteria bacterium RIFCSPHIGHO2_01_FULL_54_36]|uniref:Uncharacterized protein n=1 Tax=Candidatus Kaiserbacteria bacterium RIFCSPHIGHO2_01_FULL_54_36 TaxID=1798482 RepID=A0A1F6CL92_9BACT|nr:MAG: hypothetical protein A2763_01840 [Candidatus Kaiserbacteria bacterium RIFCSPHIGHO2_01_FULL_54_36]OGG75725.1 MAG: hypothetical protein A3A41_01865 [Candidatus Kaiserbacteria bacterium RIFCSPLOWO2_01_FULL_54_22]
MSDPRHNEVDLTDTEVAAMYSPSPASVRAWWPSVPHYWGDGVRQLLLGGATLMVVASPFYGSNLRVEFPFVIVGALVIVAFAALTSPRVWWISAVDAILSGAGAIIYATWGIFEYGTISPIALVLRLAIAFIFLFAFYFSMKTVRAFTLGQVGKRETIDEFEERDDKLA